MGRLVFRNLRGLLLTSTLVALAAGCGGGGGSSTPPPAPLPAAPPPAPAAGPTTAPAVAYTQAAALFAFIERVDIPADGRAVVQFQLADANNTAIIDLSAADVRFTLAKRQASPLGTFHGNWQSYLNRIEQPGVGPGTQPRLQAVAESGTAGTLTNHNDGSYTYRLLASVMAPTAAVLAQATAEGLDLSVDPQLTHRLAIQFGNARVALNASHDWQPASGAVDQIVRGLVTATASCNSCHGELALHGGGRVEVDYCVTCHNPGSSDANSGNSVDFAAMVHRIHRGADLPSVRAGGQYALYGFNNVLHDYSTVQHPQDVRYCTKCHSGSATGTVAGSANGESRSVATPQGDNWVEFPTRLACGSCHDDLDFASHFGGQVDDEGCRGCHSVDGAAGGVAASHTIAVDQAARRFAVEIVAVNDTAAGAFPVIDFRVVDPLAGGAPYDITSAAAFVQAGARLSMTLAWPTADYVNARPGATDASSLASNALGSPTALGNGVFRVRAEAALPDGTAAPFVAASGSGAVSIEGRAALEVDADSPGLETIPLTTTVSYFSIDAPGTAAAPRREVVTVALCQACHERLVLHGGNRSDSVEGCVTCHNPRNTDRGPRALAATPPTDGKTEEAIDFKTMIHGIHASAYRASPLQVVGFRGLSTHVYDADAVHYPRPLADCGACHVASTFGLPLAAGVLGTSVDTGADRADPGDDTVVSPATAVCASCHDSAASRAHMRDNGGDFATTQALLDTGASVELCATCHGPGAVSDVVSVHAR